MKNSRVNLIIPILILILIAGCDIVEPPQHQINPLNSKIDFRVIEAYPNAEKPSEPQIYLQLKTEKIYGCFNEEIALKYSIQGNSIDVDILGINTPNACLLALGPAQATVKLDSISGVYKLTFNNTTNNFSDSYNLLINDSLIIVDGKETQNIKPVDNFYWRHPKNSFVYVCTNNSIDPDLCDKFISTLKKDISLREFNFPDFGVDPYKNWISEDATTVKYFYYTSNQDVGKMKDIMTSFKSHYFPIGDSVNMMIITWRNDQIFSNTL